MPLILGGPITLRVGGGKWKFAFLQLGSSITLKGDVMLCMGLIPH